MPANLLVLPLLAGFLFSRICYFTRYRAQGLEGYRLLFESATLGTLFLAVTRLLILGLEQTPFGLELRSFWVLYADIPYVGSAVGSVLLAVVIAAAINVPLWESWRRAIRRGTAWRMLQRRLVRYSRILLPVGWRRSVRWRPTLRAMRQNVALDWATSKQHNHLLQLLNDAVRRRYTVAFTLSSRKFYVGFVQTAPSLDPAELYFSIYPVMSGYRDSETLAFVKTTDYEPLPEPVVIVLPIKEVQGATAFNPGIWSTYFDPAAHSAQEQIERKWSYE